MYKQEFKIEKHTSPLLKLVYSSYFFAEWYKSKYILW
jgi:hypothetical protein